MRKSIAVLMALFLVGAGGFCFIFKGIQAEENQVQFIPEQESGDVHAADGLTILMDASIKEQARWNIQSAFRGGIQTESTFSFGNSKEKPVYQTQNCYPYREAYVSSFSGGGITGGDVLSESSAYGWYSPFLSVFRKLAKEVPEDGQKEFTVKLKDYVEYYPMRIESDLYSETVMTNGNEERAITMLDIKKEAAYADISSILQIPVQGELQLEVMMQKEGDTVYDLSYDMNTFTEDRDVSAHAYSCVTYDGMLIAVDYRLEKGDGIKVFWIPFTQLAQTTMSWEDEQGNEKTLPCFVPDYQAAKLVYEETAGQVSVDYLSATEDGKDFVMIYRVNGVCSVMRLDSKDGTLLQKDISGLKEIATYFRDGDAVIGITDQIAVFDRDSNGDYQTVLLTDNQTDGEYLQDPAFAWDGERLAVTDASAGHEGAYRYSYGPSFKLYIYGEKGLLYKGMYQCTLDDMHFVESYDVNASGGNRELKWNP